MMWKYLAALILGLFPLLNCAQPVTEAPAPPRSPTPMAEEERIVKVEAEGVTLHYQAESLWSEAEFATILQNRDSFTSDLLGKFIDDVSKQGDREERVANANVRFNEDRKSTIFTCDIEDAVRKSGSVYHATFFWLLRPLGLDFIDDHFKESEKELFWEGLINSTPTSITITLPASARHCHAHVWWQLSP